MNRKAKTTTRKATKTTAAKGKATRAKRAAPPKAAATRAAFSVTKLSRIVSKRGATAESKIDQIRELISAAKA